VEQENKIGLSLWWVFNMLLSGITSKETQHLIPGMNKWLAG